LTPRERFPRPRVVRSSRRYERLRTLPGSEPPAHNIQRRESLSRKSSGGCASSSSRSLRLRRDWVCGKDGAVAPLGDLLFGVAGFFIASPPHKGDVEATLLYFCAVVKNGTTSPSPGSRFITVKTRRQSRQNRISLVLISMVEFMVWIDGQPNRAGLPHVALLPRAPPRQLRHSLGSCAPHRPSAQTPVNLLRPECEAQ
jgi:hypothetical protein